MKQELNQRSMMMNKYYTPELKEFYQGFEYEVFISASEHMDGNGWMKVSYPDPFIGSNLKALEKVLSNNRVKYLDSKDIESCGFKLIKEGYPWQYTNGTCKITTPIHTSKQSMPSNAVIVIYKGVDEQCYFEGIIKNLSELKQILEMIGIEYSK